MPKIIDNMINEGLSIENIVFGMGGGMLQSIDRDTFKMAMKCSWAEIDGVSTDVYKDPITDQGKKSKRGRLTLVQTEEEISTKRIEDVENEDIELLRVVYDNKPVEEAYEKFDTIRNRSDFYLKEEV